MKIGFGSADWSSSVFDDKGHPVWGGSGWARLGQYQHRLGHEVVVGPLISKNDTFGVQDWDGNHHFDLDVIVMQRVMFDIAEKMKRAKAEGQILINDIDDLYWNLHPANLAWKASHPQFNSIENRNHYRAIISNSSGLIISTQYLAEAIKPMIQSPSIIIGNYIDPDRFIVRQHSDSEPPCIGWVGSTSHRSGDLELLRNVLPPLVRSNSVRVQHSGHLNGAPTFAEAVGLPVELVQTLPMAGPDKYASLLNFDIGLVPLNVIPFNRAKSNIKGLEYAAAGIPFVASDIDEYSRLANEFGVGRVVRKPNQWIAALRQLCDFDTRKAEAQQNLERLQPFFIQEGAKKMKDFIESFV